MIFDTYTSRSEPITINVIDSICWRGFHFCHDFFYNFGVSLRLMNFIWQTRFQLFVCVSFLCSLALLRVFWYSFWLAQWRCQILVFQPLSKLDKSPELNHDGVGLCSSPARSRAFLVSLSQWCKKTQFVKSLSSSTQLSAEQEEEQEDVLFWRRVLSFFCSARPAWKVLPDADLSWNGAWLRTETKWRSFCWENAKAEINQGIAGQLFSQRVSFFSRFSFLFYFISSFLFWPLNNLKWNSILIFQH